jgi:hypothetical protein
LRRGSASDPLRPSRKTDEAEESIRRLARAIVLAAIETHDLQVVAGSSGAVADANPEMAAAGKRYHRSTKKWGRAA